MPIYLANQTCIATLLMRSSEPCNGTSESKPLGMLVLIVGVSGDESLSGGFGQRHPRWAWTLSKTDIGQCLCLRKLNKENHGTARIYEATIAHPLIRWRYYGKKKCEQGPVDVLSSKWAFEKRIKRHVRRLPSSSACNVIIGWIVSAYPILGRQDFFTGNFGGCCAVRSLLFPSLFFLLPLTPDNMLHSRHNSPAAFVVPGQTIPLESVPPERHVSWHLQV